MFFNLLVLGFVLSWETCEEKILYMLEKMFQGFMVVET